MGPTFFSNSPMSWPGSRSMTIQSRLAGSKPMFALGHLVHHLSICLASVVASMNPCFVYGALSARHGKTGHPFAA